jgi:hypothetical protein
MISEGASAYLVFVCAFANESEERGNWPKYNGLKFEKIRCKKKDTFYARVD